MKNVNKHTKAHGQVGVMLQLHLQLHYTTPHHSTSSSCGWGDHCNHSKKHNSNHLSVHQFALPFMHHNTSPLLYFPILETSATALCSNTGKMIKMILTINAIKSAGVVWFLLGEGSTSPFQWTTKGLIQSHQTHEICCKLPKRWEKSIFSSGLKTKSSSPSRHRQMSSRSDIKGSP